MSFILGMGNPLLDISSEVKQDFIDKYEVKLGDACLCSDKHKGMYAELSAMESVQYIAGGATLNAIRVAQWVLGEEGRTGYIGAIGNDVFGTLMKEQCKKDGVMTEFMVNPDVPTGACAVAIYEKERGLVANLAAANTYKKEHLVQHEKLCARARIIYSAGFFLTVCPDAMIMAAECTRNTNGVYCLNLAAPFIITAFKDPLAKVIEVADYVFSNEDEAKAYGETQNMSDTSPSAVAKYLAQVPSKKQSRTAIVTQGSQRTIVARSDGFYMEVPVARIDPSKIIDLNAAGDSFVGGFLASLARGDNLEECVLSGHKAARYIIQRSGCTLEGTSASRLND